MVKTTVDYKGLKGNLTVSAERKALKYFHSEKAGSIPTLPPSLDASQHQRYE
ncbi:MAG: hypothetical protein L3J32_10480 [Rhizobiaceae bacterium]|nr:hypothetical protein [Rhizobiaceae bacterium]